MSIDEKTISLQTHLQHYYLFKTMKKLLFVSMLLAMINLTGCDNKKEENNATPDSLGGTEWSGTERYNYYDDDGNIEETVMLTFAMKVHENGKVDMLWYEDGEFYDDAVGAEYSYTPPIMTARYSHGDYGEDGEFEWECVHKYEGVIDGNKMKLTMWNPETDEKTDFITITRIR